MAQAARPTRDPRRGVTVAFKATDAEAAWLLERARPGARPTWSMPRPPSISTIMRELLRLAMRDPEVERRLIETLTP